jgi:hypothetical protein
MSAEVAGRTKTFDAWGALCTWLEALLSDPFWLGLEIAIDGIGLRIPTLLKLDQVLNSLYYTLKLIKKE